MFCSTLFTNSDAVSLREMVRMNLKPVEANGLLDLMFVCAFDTQGRLGLDFLNKNTQI